MGFSARAILFLALASSLSCSVNVLENFADKTTGEALFVEAQILINQGDYDTALAKIALITGALATDRKVIALKASAYGGKCGLNFLDFVNALQNMGASSLFEVLLANFVSGSATRIDNCVLAENLIESIGAVAARTADENLLLALISFAKIGNIVALYTDADDDGTADVGFNTCNVGVSRVAGNITDADIRELGTGLTLAIETLGAVSGSISLGGSSLTALNAGCATLNAANPSYNFCAVTDPTAFTALHLQAIRGLTRETNDGIGLKLCAGGSATCACP